MANSLKDKLAANAAIKGNGLDALLGKNPMDAMRVDDRRVQDIALSKLHPFNGHTFRVVKNSVSHFYISFLTSRHPRQRL